MKKRFFGGLVLVALNLMSGGQVAGQTWPGPQQPVVPISYEQASPAAWQDLEVIFQALGVTGKVAFLAGDVGNAMATAVRGRDGRMVPVIIYNREFMNGLAEVNPWAPISVLAHEVGHLYLNHPLHQGGETSHQWKFELDADRISGCVMARLGAAETDATAAMETYFTAVGSSSHPRTRLRLRAITEGWQSCSH